MGKGFHVSYFFLKKKSGKKEVINPPQGNSKGILEQLREATEEGK